MILCGGLGKRLGENKPKALVELKEGLTILEYQLYGLKKAGIREVYLLTGFGHEQIEERIGNEWKGLKIIYSREKRKLGTGGAIKNCIETYNLRNERLVILNGDVIYRGSLRRILKRSSQLTDEGIFVTMLIVPLVSRYGIVHTDERRIIKFEEKPVLPYFINGGIYVVNQCKEFDLAEYIPEPPNDIEKSTFPFLVEKGVVGWYRDTKSLWISIETRKDVERARNLFKELNLQLW